MHRPMRRLLLLPVLAVALAACGGGDDSGGSTTSAACPSGDVVIKMANIKFDPESATAGVGQEVCWINEDSVDHNVVAQSGADFESELYGKGELFTAKVDSPGTVEYECTIHPGMTGTLQIER
jgi:plastocyanin